MAHSYDIYLRKRLTEFDIIIQNLPYRDGLIVYNKTYLDAMINYLYLQKFIVGEGNQVLQAEIDTVLEHVFNVLNVGADLDVQVELFAGKPISGISGIYLDTSTLPMYEEVFNGFKTFTQMTTSILNYDLAKTLGSGKVRMWLNTKVEKTLKEGFDKFKDEMMLLAGVETAAEKYSDISAEITLLTAPFDIFYMIAVQGEALMNLSCSADLEMWYTLGKGKNELVLTVENSAIYSEKYLTYCDFISLAMQVNEVLECFIHLSNKGTVLDTTLSVGMKRHRLLSELDEMTFADLDAMSLNDLDYVIIA